MDTVVFDKTGTLTRGAMTLGTALTDEDEDTFLRFVASLEAASDHPIARAVVLGAEERDLDLHVVDHATVDRGNGITGSVGNVQGAAGRPAFMQHLGYEGVEAWRSKFDDVAASGATTFMAGWDGRVRGIVSVTDSVRPEAHGAVEALHDMEVGTVMLTGDTMQSAELVAASVGIDSVVAEVLPAGKVEAIADLQAGGSVVGFVGDGINDAPALTAADLGMAVGSGSDVAIEAGDVVLMNSDPTAAVSAIDLARRTFRVIRQNLFWAFAYNTAAIPLAALGFLNPMIAAAAMAFSSVSVVVNSLRLRRYEPAIADAHGHSRRDGGGADTESRTASVA